MTVVTLWILRWATQTMTDCWRSGLGKLDGKTWVRRWRLCWQRWWHGLETNSWWTDCEAYSSFKLKTKTLSSGWTSLSSFLVGYMLKWHLQTHFTSSTWEQHPGMDWNMPLSFLKGKVSLMYLQRVHTKNEKNMGWESLGMVYDLMARFVLNIQACKPNSPKAIYQRSCHVVQQPPSPN